MICLNHQSFEFYYCQLSKSDISDISNISNITNISNISNTSNIINISIISNIPNIQGVFVTGAPPKSSKYKKVNLG